MLDNHTHAPCSYGSSPRMWGTFCGGIVVSGKTWFIPTDVGNISSPISSPMFANGSSPRMWGTFNPHSGNKHQHRFIPTYVGNMLTWQTQRTLISVHPHGCGEHLLRGSAEHLYDGSSPHRWGTYHNSRRKLQPARFIPTYVGNMLLPPLTAA